MPVYYKGFNQEWGFLDASAVKESASNAIDKGLIPGLGRCPGGGNGNSLQYSCLENPMDGDPGGLQSMGSERIGHNRAAEHNTKASLHSMIDEVIVQW